MYNILGDVMARNTHKSEKRRKELDRLKKQEEKRNRRLNKGSEIQQPENTAEQEKTGTDTEGGGTE